MKFSGYLYLFIDYIIITYIKKESTNRIPINFRFLVKLQKITSLGHIFHELKNPQICVFSQDRLRNSEIYYISEEFFRLNRECTELKIADFGLSRHFSADATYSCTNPVRLPIRWVAVECFGESGEVLRNCKVRKKIFKLA